MKMDAIRELTERLAVFDPDYQRSDDMRVFEKHAMLEMEIGALIDKCAALRTTAPPTYAEQFAEAIDRLMAPGQPGDQFAAADLTHWELYNHLHSFVEALCGQLTGGEATTDELDSALVDIGLMAMLMRVAVIREKATAARSRVERSE